MGRRTKCAAILTCLLSAWIASPSAWAEDARPTSFSVKDFGAKGDGKADDTKAIQAAFEAAGKKTWSEQYPGGAYFTSVPVVFFPSGKYLVSDTINAGANVQGEGMAIVQQKDPEKDIFSSTQCWRWQISGLTLVAGRHHLHLGNPNIDTGRILVEKCAFYNADGTAVKVRKGSNSTQISIRDCVFIGCDQAFVNYCDMATLSDSWIYSSKQMKNKAVIENRNGCLLLESICGVPAVSRDNDQRWIDNYSVVTVRNFRFGGEDAGFTPVVNFAPYDSTYPVWPTAVVLDSCEIYAIGNPKRRAAVFCEEVPNQIVVRNCRGLIDLPVVRVSDNLNLDTYFDNAEKRPACLKFVVGEENVEVTGSNRELPEPMRPYQANKIAGDAKPGSASAPAAKRTPRLAEWEGLKYGMFIHFGMSTFTGDELDDGKSASTTYAPTQLDVRQWVRTAKQAGMKYMVLTAKHHSGHCLWDSADYDYDVATSGDKTDVVAEFMKACKEEGIKPGIYYAILDGHNGGTGVPGGPVNDRYFQFVKRQLTELHTRYPGIYEQWIDIPLLLSESQRQELYELIKKLTPDCLVLMNQSFQLGWPTDLFYGERVYPSAPRYNPAREFNGKSYYVPKEVCDTIGKNWFWTPNDPPKDVRTLYKMYSESVGRGANLLLDVPPDKSGRIPRDLVDALMKLKAVIDDPTLLPKE